MWFKKSLGVKSFSHKIGALSTYYDKKLRQGTASRCSKGVKISTRLFALILLPATFLRGISPS
jgi:hypothetical protein